MLPGFDNPAPVCLVVNEVEDLLRLIVRTAESSILFLTWPQAGSGMVALKVVG